MDCRATNRADVDTQPELDLQMVTRIEARRSRTINGEEAAEVCWQLTHKPVETSVDAQKRNTVAFTI